MLKGRAILCELVCMGLVVTLCGCGKPEGGQPGNNGGGKPIARKDPIVEKRAALEGTEWDIKVTYLADGEKKTRADKLIFADNRICIKDFKEKWEFPASNYTLEVRADGEVALQAMQRNENGDILFLKGKWRGDQMRGTITRRPKDGENERSSFMSTASRKSEKTASATEKSEKEG